MKPVVDMQDVMKDVTMHVEVIQTKRFKLRMRTGMLLFRFAAWVTGCGIDIKII